MEMVKFIMFLLLRYNNLFAPRIWTHKIDYLTWRYTSVRLQTLHTLDLLTVSYNTSVQQECVYMHVQIHKVKIIYVVPYYYTYI